MLILFSTKTTNDGRGTRYSFQVEMFGKRVINHKSMTMWRNSFWSYSRTLGKPGGFTSGESFRSLHLFNFSFHVEKKRNKSTVRKLWHFAG